MVKPLDIIFLWFLSEFSGPRHSKTDPGPPRTTPRRPKTRPRHAKIDPNRPRSLPRGVYKASWERLGGVLSHRSAREQPRTSPDLDCEGFWHDFKGHVVPFWPRFWKVLGSGTLLSMLSVLSLQYLQPSFGPLFNS